MNYRHSFYIQGDNLTMFLKDKVTFITGGAKNLGRAMAFEFAQQGLKIVINSRTDTS
jgi:3-oxoacyl-[acyl-carrier protein] reductase